MSTAWRVLVVLAVAFGVGFGTCHAIIAHAVAGGAQEYQVRLAGQMAGLFAGGTAAVLTAILLFWRKGAR